MKKMKLSTLIEVLLILIIIAFAASKPVDQTETRVLKYVRKNAALAKQQPVADAVPAVVVAPVAAAVEAVTPANAATTPDDVDVDDILGLVVGEDDDDEEEEEEEEEPVEAEDPDDDDDDLFGLGGDDADDEPEALAAEAVEEVDADTDEGAFGIFGGDFFEALFEDETTTKKPKVKPSVVPTVVAAPVEAAIAASQAASVAAAEAAAADALVVPGKKAPIQQNKIKRRKVVPVKPIAQPTLEKTTLNFQHTPALLELSQSSIKKPNEDQIIIGLEPGQHVPEKVVVIQVPESTNNDEATAVNQVTEQLMENNEIPSEKVTIEHVPQLSNDLNSDEDEDNMIIISSSSDNETAEKNTQPEEEEEEETSESDDVAAEVEEDENDSAESDKVQETVVTESVEVSTVAIAKKKPIEKEDEGLLETVVDLIEDDDDEDEVKDDGTKDEVVVTEDTSVSEEDEKDSTEKDDDDDEEDEEEEDDDDDDDDDDDSDNKNEEKPATETKVPEKGNKTKKKKDTISFASIGETLGLSRIFRAKAE